MKLTLWPAPLLVLAITACTEERTTGPISADTSALSSEAKLHSATAPPLCNARSNFAPRGLRVPAGSRACRFLDRIFNPEEGRHALSNTRPEANIVVTDPKRIPPHITPRSRNRPSSMLPQPGNGDSGWYVAQYYTWGLGNEEIVHRDLEIPAEIADSAPPDTGAVIYAPTNAPRNACLELTVMYIRLPGAGTTTRELGWYDWCLSQPRWDTIEDMNSSTWANSYVDSSYWYPEAQGEAVIYWGLMTDLGSDCTQGVIFNFQAGHYDTKAFSCGTPNNSTGWSMWESYHLMDKLSDPTRCPVEPRSDAEIRVFASAQAETTNTYLWLDQANISPLGPYGLCWNSGFYTINWYRYPTGSASAWRAFTP
jgi:hypothetical protein